MMCLSKWLGVVLVSALTASNAAADTIASGQVMTMNPANRTFRLQFDKRTFKLGENCVVRRGAVESAFKKSELKNGEEVQCYSDQPGGTLIRYILVKQAGALPKGTGPESLVVGVLKRVTKTTALISINQQDPTPFAIGDTKVRLDTKNCTMKDLKEGDKVLFITFITSGTQTLRDVMAERK